MDIKLPRFENGKVLVIGDIMLDRYWHGDTQRISPEAPVPVVKIEEIEERPGGAANVALNIRSLGGQVSLLGYIGDDKHGEVLHEKISTLGFNNQIITAPNHQTITKLRILSLHQQLLRLDFEQNFQDVNHDQLFQNYCEELNNVSVVILSDYGKGTLDNPQRFIQAAKAKNIPVLVDPKGSNFSIYKDVFLLTPNRKEYENIVGPCQSEEDFINKGIELIDRLSLKALLVTRGAQGMTLLRTGFPELHLPAKTREVYDVTGAGDTVIGVLALCLASGADLEFATIIANRAAGIVVGKLGAAAVSIHELRRALQFDHAKAKGVMTEEQLIIHIHDAKAHQEKIVMTNGCFDILHPGHVAYLESAKALGDRLIVAVNDDASVKKLKGSSRPINSLSQRMAVLAGLSSVDWVVPFSEDTPERIISEIMPDILVKGGDYRAEEIAGHKQVLANGGEVHVLQFVEGHSTSAIVSKIKTEELA